MLAPYILNASQARGRRYGRLKKAKNQAKKLMTPLLVNHGGKLPSERYVIR